MERGRSIILIGFMGSGKSSVGRSLAATTGWPRRDTDEMVSAQAGMSVADIFAQAGEEKFRALETAALEKLADETAIVATGGGIILLAKNVEILRRLGTIVYLSADEEILFERAARSGRRPLLKTENPRRTFSELLQKRMPIYRAAADFEIDTSQLRAAEIAQQILSKIDER